MSLILDALRQIDPHIFERLHAVINEDSLYRYLKPIADTHAPTQTVRLTRAAVLEDLLRQDGLLEHPNFDFDRDFKQTGNTVIRLGKNPYQKQAWLLGHLDQISYLVEPGSDGRYPLTPICYHLMEPGRRPAVALGYDIASRQYQLASRGEIYVAADDRQPYFLPDGAAALRPGMRVCFDSQLSWNRQSGEVRGSLDDAAAAASLIMAAIFLADYDVEVMVGLTDEEEGRGGSGTQSFCRGGARLLRYFEQPELVIGSDIHEAQEMYGGGGPKQFKPGDGASFSEKSSAGVGEITPPHLYELQRQLALELDSVGIQLRENLGGYVSRTESVNAILRTPNVALLGFLGANRHFQGDVESANIRDLVNLAKAIVCYTLLIKTPIW